MKKQRRSKKQWQELFELRKTFQGSTEEFCRQYEVPNSSYYTNYAMLDFNLLKVQKS